nr:hypothetical protein [Tanacetum cinerariifolium]
MVGIICEHLAYAQLCVMGLQSCLLVSMKTHQGGVLSIRIASFVLPLLDRGTPGSETIEHSSGMILLLCNVTIPPATRNFIISCAVDGIARIFLTLGLPIIPLPYYLSAKSNQGSVRGNQLAFDLWPNFTEAMLIQNFQGRASIHIYAVHTMSFYLCLNDHGPSVPSSSLRPFLLGDLERSRLCFRLPNLFFSYDWQNLVVILVTVFSLIFVRDGPDKFCEACSLPSMFLTANVGWLSGVCSLLLMASSTNVF